MISSFFIRRPIFATVLSVIIVLAGLLALRNLPIEQYPNIVPPEISITAIYPGASPEVLAETVAAPLEQAVNGVENMIYMRSSSSSTGMVTINVSFDIGTDPDQAAVNVNNMVATAEARLPEDVRRLGVTVLKQSSSILQVLSLSSDTPEYDDVYLSNYALINIIDEIKRIPGVGQASLFGQKDYSMRIWLSPDKLAQYNLTTTDVAAAISQQNSQFAAGKFGAEPSVSDQVYTYTVSTQGRLADPAEFENIILRSSEGGAMLRLKDVARVELGAQDYSFTASQNDQPSTPIGIFLQPGANALAVAEAIQTRMDELSREFPAGVKYAVPFDTTKFVRVSITEVVKTFFEAMTLVVLVVYVFLQNWRATLIPLMAVPVAIIGTFGGMMMFGFSINLLTLFGMVLAIGIVVDDAIIVIENVERIMTQEKKSPIDATIQAMHEVTGPIIAIVLVLSSVFLPVAFLGGLTGVMYRQFAVTISVSVAISGFVALTLTPALCAVLLEPTHHTPIAPLRWFNALFERVSKGYLSGVNFLLKRALLGFGMAAAILALTYGVFTRVPSSLVPAEDQGFLIAAYILPPATALSRTDAVAREMGRRLEAHEAVDSALTFAGFDILTQANMSNGGVSFISLKDWDERTSPELNAINLVGGIMGMGADIKEGLVLAFNPAPISGMSLTGGVEGYIQNRAGDSVETMVEKVNAFVAAAQGRPELASVQSTFSANTPQYRLDVDREKAAALGVPLTSIFTTMQATFGTFYVNDFTMLGRNFRVNMQAEAQFRGGPEGLDKVFVRAQSGALVPLSSLVKVERTVGPDLMQRFNGFPAANILAEPRAGYSSGQALSALQETATDVLGAGYSLGWVGSAYQEMSVADVGSQPFMLGVLMIFLILSALYERWSIPLAVITAVPFAVFGAITLTWLRGLSNDIYFQIGLVTLIGLSAKNAILIVEFAMIRMREGRDVLQAAREAAALRFRPIVMTSLSFTMGSLPLAFSSGAGSASRIALGTGVIGGILAATFIATFFIPLFFTLIAGISEKFNKKAPA
ncbi:MAG: multidrug efflux RND transporter permease subunit [Pseudomonadales bacterium]|jgi:multidrug efflux pump|nr:multidrug efflux RND transporter permease subunit [Pseudomonadales bacterium]